MLEIRPDNGMPGLGNLAASRPRGLTSPHGLAASPPNLATPQPRGLTPSAAAASRPDLAP